MNNHDGDEMVIAGRRRANRITQRIVAQQEEPTLTRARNLTVRPRAHVSSMNDLQSVLNNGGRHAQACKL